MISITNLKKKFGDFTAVDGLSFEINETAYLLYSFFKKEVYICE